MVEIVVNPITRQDRDRWAELWRGYLDFYETRLPPEIYDHTWQRLIAADGPIRGLGARLGGATAPLAGIGKRKTSGIDGIGALWPSSWTNTGQIRSPTVSTVSATNLRDQASRRLRRRRVCG